MAFLKLHSRLNPERVTLQESTEISSVSEYMGGSLIQSKGGSQVIVKETPEEIFAMIKEKEA
jgi:hypothetical protein